MGRGLEAGLFMIQGSSETAGGKEMQVSEGGAEEIKRGLLWDNAGFPSVI